MSSSVERREIQSGNAKIEIETGKVARQAAGAVTVRVGDTVVLVASAFGTKPRELAQLISKKRPGLCVLYMSGHDKEIIAQRGVLDPGMTFIEKSFSAEGLCQKVRQVLDAASKKETYA